MKSKRAVKELEGKREKLCSQVLRCVWCKEEDLGRWGPGGIVRGHQVVDDRHGEGEEREREREREKEKEREWEHRGGGEPSECAVVSKKEVEKRTATAGRGQRGRANKLPRRSQRQVKQRRRG